MSIIHEALKRAERDRSAGSLPKAAVPTVVQSTIPAAAPAKMPRRDRRWIAAAIGTPLLLAAGVYFSRRSDQPRAVPPAPGVIAFVPEQAQKPASLPPAPRPAESVLSDPAAAPAPVVAPAAGLSPARLNARAVASFREGRPEEARSFLEQALRLDPALPEAHNNLGMVLQALGRRSEAREEFQRALALLPRYPEALNNLGLAWSGEGNQNEAIRSFEKALALKPGYSSARLNLAIVLDKLEKKSDALYHYRRYVDDAGPGEQELVRRVNDRLRRLR